MSCRVLTPAGRYLKAEQHFSKITVFEMRDKAGGIWNRDNMTLSSPKSILTEADLPTVKFPSPIYDELESNIPTPIMQYSHRPFADGVLLLPRTDEVLEYLCEYAQDVEELILFKSDVTEVRPL